MHVKLHHARFCSLTPITSFPQDKWGSPLHLQWQLLMDATFNPCTSFYSDLVLCLSCDEEPLFLIACFCILNIMVIALLLQTNYRPVRYNASIVSIQAHTRCSISALVATNSSLSSQSLISPLGMPFSALPVSLSNRSSDISSVGHSVIFTQSLGMPFMPGRLPPFEFGS